MSDSPTATQAVIALGELSILEGFALAGVEVRQAETDSEALTQWSSLDAHTGVVILTPRSSVAVGARMDQPGAPMTVVLPE